MADTTAAARTRAALDGIDPTAVGAAYSPSPALVSKRRAGSFVEDEERLLEVCKLEPADDDRSAPADPLTPSRHVYRTHDRKQLVLVEHAGSLARQVGERVPRVVPRIVAANVLMSNARTMTDPTALFAVSMGLIDAIAEIDRLKAKLVAAEARP